MKHASGMKGRWVAVAIGLAFGTIGAGSANAHHSFAMYDQSKTETMTGRLTRFIPGANHAQLIFEIIDDSGKTKLGDDGKPVIWGIELGPAAAIAQQGVTVEAFPLGTVLTVTLNPLPSGRRKPVVELMKMSSVAARSTVPSWWWKSWTMLRHTYWSNSTAQRPEM